MQEEVLAVETVHSISIRKTMFLACKRAFDIFCSLIGLILLSPLFLIVSIIIKIDSKGPVFLVQKRIGKNGKEFNFYKFRSMVVNADNILFEMLEKDPKMKEEYEKNKKLNHDPRITKIGRFIRRYSIDELPQLLNILKGDMSVIGNRPYLPREKKDMNGYFDEIVKTKPGLTGYWETSLYANISSLNFMKGVA